MALIGIRKLNIEEVNTIFNPNEWEISKGVYYCPCFKRNNYTGDVIRLPEKEKVDYFIHMKGNPSLNRIHIQKRAAKHIASLLGIKLSDIKDTPNY